MIAARRRIKIILYGIIAIIGVLLLVRFLLDLVGASEEAGFTQLFKGITDIFIDPFKGIVAKPLELGQNINLDAIVALLFFVVLGTLSIEIFTGFLFNTIYGIIENAVDAVFKVIEAILFLRIIFDLFTFDVTSPFVILIKNITSWANIFENPSFIAENINLSVITILVLIVILDIFIGNIVTSVFEFKKVKPIQIIKKEVQLPAAPPSQNITVHVHNQGGAKEYKEYSAPTNPTTNSPMTPQPAPAAQQVRVIPQVVPVPVPVNVAIPAPLSPKPNNVSPVQTQIVPPNPQPIPVQNIPINYSSQTQLNQIGQTQQTNQPVN